MTLTQVITTGQSLIERAQRAYDAWHLAQLKARLASLPDECHLAREVAHARYVRTLRHIDKREAVEAIELEFEIKELEGRV